MTADGRHGHIRPLFATPVVMDDLQGAAALNAELERTITDRRAADSGLKLSNRGGWQSKHDFAAWAGAGGEQLLARALALAEAHTQRTDGSPPRWRVDA